MTVHRNIHARSFALPVGEDFGDNATPLRSAAAEVPSRDTDSAARALARAAEAGGVFAAPLRFEVGDELTDNRLNGDEVDRGGS